MTWKNARQNTIGAFVLLGPLFAAASFLLLQTLSPAAILFAFLPWPAIFILLLGFIPAFLTGMAYVILLRYRVIRVSKLRSRVIGAALIGGALAPISGAVLVGASQDWTKLPMTVVGKLMVAGAMGAGICATFLPRPRWRKFFGADSDTYGAA